MEALGGEPIFFKSAQVRADGSEFEKEGPGFLKVYYGEDMQWRGAER